MIEASATAPASIASVEDHQLREMAEQMEQENPLWLVVFGTCTRQFVCFPRFDVPPGTILVASYPGALPARMRAIEHAAQRQPARRFNR